MPARLTSERNPVTLWPRVARKRKQSPFKISYPRVHRQTVGVHRRNSFRIVPALDHSD